MCSPPRVPARVNCFERNPAAFIRHLRAAEEGLAGRVDRAVISLPRIARVQTARIAMPNVDPCSRYRRAWACFDDAQPQPQGDSVTSLRDVRADEFRIEVKRSLNRLRSKDTRFRLLRLRLWRTLLIVRLSEEGPLNQVLGLQETAAVRLH